MSRALNGALISAFSMPGPLPLMLMAVACVVVGAARANAADSPARRPNVIFILTDDQGWGDGHFAGHPYVKTPHLDRLAREGTWFRQFYVAATVCSPSRAAFMTSHYPARHAIHGHFATDESNAARSMPNWLDPDVTTLPDLLKTVGYATAHFGKWHLGGGRNAPAPEQYGFDESKTVNSSGPSLGDEGKTPYFRAESTRLIVDETIDFIRRRHEAGPFYANVWTLLPHAHLKPTPEQLAVYAGLEPKADDPAFGPWMRKYLSAAEDLRSQMQVFCASLTDLDTQIGRLLDVLDELGIADDTIVVLSSDNGPEDYRVKNAANAGVGSTGPLRARKRSMYEGGIRTFGLVRWPGTVPAGRVDETSVVGAVDLLPTIAALAGVAVPADLAADGEDQSGVWRGGRALRNKPLHWEWLFGVQGQQDGFMPPPLAVRDGDWKLFVNHDGTGAQLYSIPNDPGESRDVAAEQPEMVKALTAKAVAWARSLPPSPARDTVASGGTVEKQMRGNKKAAGKAAATDSDAPQATAPLDRPRIFVSWDADSDGFLSREEYVSRLRGQADAPERFRRFDTDGDGRLTRDEFVRAGR